VRHAEHGLVLRRDPRRERRVEQHRVGAELAPQRFAHEVELGARQLALEMTCRGAHAKVEILIERDFSALELPERSARLHRGRALRAIDRETFSGGTLG